MYYFLVKVNLRSLLSSWSGVRLPLGVPPNFRHLPSLGGCHFFSIWLSFQSSFHPEEVPRLERPAWPRHGACDRSWGLQPSGWRWPARCAEMTWRERRRAWRAPGPGQGMRVFSWGASLIRCGHRCAGSLSARS